MLYLTYQVWYRQHLRQNLAGRGAQSSFVRMRRDLPARTGRSRTPGTDYETDPERDAFYRGHLPDVFEILGDILANGSLPCDGLRRRWLKPIARLAARQPDDRRQNKDRHQQGTGAVSRRSAGSGWQLSRMPRHVQ